MRDETPYDIPVTRGRRWPMLALTAGALLGLVLLFLWGASASPTGGCGGG